VATRGLERGVLITTYLAMAVLGMLSGIIDAFLVPQRLFDGVEGLSILLAVAGNIGLGLLGGLGTRTVTGAVAPMITWFVTVGILSLRGPGGDLIVPGALRNDPGITWVTNFLLLGGALSSAVAIALTMRYTMRVNQPRSDV
jgi:hypothetical protein